jgi:DNA polymerase-3 subunit delta
MPVYFYWGEDDFSLTMMAKRLQKEVLDNQWLGFNFEKIAGEQGDATERALEQALTPPFGAGGRLVWVVESTLGQQCSEALLERLRISLPKIPPSNHLLFTASKKLDARLKSSKLLQEQAQVRELPLISPWKTEELVHQIQAIAADLTLKLTPAAESFLAEALGNNTRQIWNELEKLKLLSLTQDQPLDIETIEPLVNASAQNSLQLAQAIRSGATAKAVALTQDLLARNEAALRIVAILVGQFRTWLLLKLSLENGEKDDKVIAARAELNNPKRLYFLRKELNTISSKQLLACWPLLLELELQLKQGGEISSTLKTKVVEMSELCRKRRH